jgi:hypothetical protein
MENITFCCSYSENLCAKSREMQSVHFSLWTSVPLRRLFSLALSAAYVS